MADERLVVNLFFRNERKGSSELTIKDTSKTPVYVLQVFSNSQSSTSLSSVHTRDPFVVRVFGTNPWVGHSFKLEIVGAQATIGSNVTWQAGSGSIEFPVTMLNDTGGIVTFNLRDVNTGEVVGTLRFQVIVPTYVFDLVDNPTAVRTLSSWNVSEGIWGRLTVSNGRKGDTFSISSSNIEIVSQPNITYQGEDGQFWIAFRLRLVSKTNSGTTDITVKNVTINKDAVVKSVNVVYNNFVNVNTVDVSDSTWNRVGAGTTTYANYRGSKIDPYTSMLGSRIMQVGAVDYSVSTSGSTSQSGLRVRFYNSYNNENVSDFDNTSEKPAQFRIVLDGRTYLLSRFATESSTSDSQFYRLPFNGPNDSGVVAFYNSMVAAKTTTKLITILEV